MSVILKWSIDNVCVGMLNSTLWVLTKCLENRIWHKLGTKRNFIFRTRIDGILKEQSWGNVRFSFPHWSLHLGCLVTVSSLPTLSSFPLLFLLPASGTLHQVSRRTNFKNNATMCSKHSKIKTNFLLIWWNCLHIFPVAHLPFYHMSALPLGSFTLWETYSCNFIWTSILSVTAFLDPFSKGITFLLFSIMSQIISRKLKVNISISILG